MCILFCWRFSLTWTLLYCYPGETISLAILTFLSCISAIAVDCDVLTLGASCSALHRCSTRWWAIWFICMVDFRIEKHRRIFCCSIWLIYILDLTSYFCTLKRTSMFQQWVAGHQTKWEVRSLRSFHLIYWLWPDSLRMRLKLWDLGTYCNL